MVDHAECGVAVGLRIESVEPVGKHSYGAESVVESLQMGVDVGSVGKSAHNENIGTEAFKSGDETLYDVYAVRSAVACADDAYDVAFVYVGITFIIQCNRSIGTVV